MIIRNFEERRAKKEREKKKEAQRRYDNQQITHSLTKGASKSRRPSTLVLREVEPGKVIPLIRPSELEFLQEIARQDATARAMVITGIDDDGNPVATFAEENKTR